MVLIYTHTTTARLQYICTFIFKQLLNVNFAITIDSEEFKNYDGIYFCETRDDLVRMLTESNHLFRRLSLDRMNLRNDALSRQFGVEIISKEIVGILSND